jgi:hypothetical protein
MTDGRPLISKLRVYTADSVCKCCIVPIVREWKDSFSVEK